MGGAGKEELERKYATWVDNLALCVDAGDDGGELCVDVCDDGGEQGDASDQWSEGERGGGVLSNGERGGGVLGDSDRGGVSVESHSVHPVLDRFIFASRPWSAAAPQIASSNDCGVDEGQRAALVAQWEAQRREAKHARRSARWSEGERATHEQTRLQREANALRVVLVPHAGGGREVSVRFEVEVHNGRRVSLV